MLKYLRHHPKLAFGLVFLIGFAVFAYRASVFRITQNFAVVDPGKVYRSAQLSTEELKEIIAKYNIKTVISLRGYPLETPFYHQQDKVLKAININFLPLDMSENFYPSEQDLREVFKVFQSDKYPILIHCRVGADRTGMISAIYQQAYMQKTVEDSLAQLSFANWHVQTFKPAMSDFVKKFKGVNWALTTYTACSPEFEKYRETSRDCKN